MTGSSSESPEARRLRRLRELGQKDQIRHVNNAVSKVWQQEGGRRPPAIWLRPGFLIAPRDESGRHPGPMSRLISSRGVALRFYLLAVFDALCRPPSGEPWRNTRPVSGRRGWADLIAVDAAYSRPARAYQLGTRQTRTLDTSRARQVQSALRQLEELGDQALAEVPRKANGKDRDYAAFLLMKETGRGGEPTPDYYTPGPSPVHGAVDIPVQFFLNGWVQLLYPSEIATWLTLRLLRSWFPGQHNEGGVYLYGKDREDAFGLLRDSYEDSCRSLLEFGLIRRARPTGSVPGDPAVPPTLADFFAMASQMMPTVDENGQVRHQANLYQLADGGLDEQAYPVVLTSVQARL